MAVVTNIRAFQSTEAVPALGSAVGERRFGKVELIGARARYRRNEEIFGEGDETGHVYRVLTGAVRIYRVLADGRRRVDDFCRPGDLFGLELGSHHRISADAVTDSELVVTSRRVVMQQMEHNCAFGKLLFEHTSAGLAKAQDHALLLGRKNAIERVVEFVLEMSQRQANDGEVNLPMSRHDIADYLGLTIETVSRTLAELDRQNVLDVAARNILIRDPARLRRLSS